MASKRDLCERESEKRFRTEVVASVTLPSLGRSHCLTTGKMLAIMQVQSAPGDLPEDVVRSGVVKQIETLFFAVVELNSQIDSQRTRILSRGEN